MKERVTLTIEASLLRQIDNSVDGNEIRNRSHAVELLLREAMQNSAPAHGVLLAGGSTQAVDRVLRVKDGQTYLEHNLQLLLEAGIEHIIIISKEPSRLQEVLKEAPADIQYVTETHSLGTAGALHLAKPYIKGSFVVTNCDDRKNVNIKDMYAFHQQTSGACTIALTTTNNPSEYGVALLNGNRIVTFVEKPDKEQTPSNLISAGLYIMEQEVLDIVPSGYGRMEYDLFPKLTKKDELYGYPFSGLYEHTES